MTSYTIVRGQFECEWCDKAAVLLADKAENFDVIKMVMGDLIEAQIEWNHVTVPMIFQGDTFIGGYDDLVATLQ